MFLSGIEMGVNVVCTSLLPGTQIGALVKLQYEK